MGCFGGFQARPEKVSFRLFFLCLCTACILFFVSCTASSAQNLREMAPQEFSWDVDIAYPDFTAQGIFQRTVRGEYTLRYTAPQTIAGLSYGWISGEVTRGLHNLDEVTPQSPEDFFSRLAGACETYYDVESEGLSMEKEESAIRFVHKEFTILANSKNGQILKISFPTQGISVQMKEEIK